MGGGAQADGQLGKGEEGGRREEVKQKNHK